MFLVGPLLLPPSVLSLVIYSFLPPFSVQETYIVHLSTIQECHKEIVWSRLMQGASRG